MAFNPKKFSQYPAPPKINSTPPADYYGTMQNQARIQNLAGTLGSGANINSFAHPQATKMPGPAMPAAPAMQGGSMVYPGAAEMQQTGRRTAVAPRMMQGALI